MFQLIRVSGHNLTILQEISYKIYQKYTTRMRSRWGVIANPHAKVFDPPAPPSPTPGA